MSDDAPGFDVIYGELRRLAQSKVERGLAGRSLQATALVHDVWLKLSEGAMEPDGDGPMDRGHYLATASQAMRWLLVDRARRRRSKGIATVFGRSESELAQESPAEESPAHGRHAEDDRLLALDAALTRLAKSFPRKADVVTHRYFAGLSVEDTATALGISPATVKREWSFARAWLIRELGDELSDFSDS
ncbi:MAG: ECF-type sigma factor [Planctomycetota bacterium]